MHSTARVGGDLGGVLVVDGAHFEDVPCVDASGVGGDGGGVCVHFLCMVLNMCGFGWLWQAELVLIGK